MKSLLIRWVSLMDKFLATFMLTYKNKVKAKSFIIFTTVVVLLIVLLANVNKIIEFFDDGEDKIGVAAPTTELYEAVKSQNKQFGDDVQFVKISEKDAKSQIRDEKIDDAFVIKEGQDQQLEGKILSHSTVSAEDEQLLQTVLSQIQSQMRAAQMDLTPKQLADLQAQSKVSSEVVSTSSDGSSLSPSQQALNSIIINGGVFLMFFIIINYSSQVGMEIATEKTSRVIEMIITSVKPVTHITAKICGILAVAFTQVFIFVATAVICFFVFDVSDLLDGFEFETNPETTRLIVVGIIFLILGIISYVLLSALLGSITARIEDINQTFMPVTLISIVGLYIGIFSFIKPENMLEKVTSFIPLLSPFIMFIRSSTPDVSWIEIFISMGLSVIAIVLLAWLTLRSYKDSVLRFDKGLIQSFKRLFKQ